jgi:hypothetical protein
MANVWLITADFSPKLHPYAGPQRGYFNEF